MFKTKLVHLCYVVPNLVVHIEIFNFCLFVCLLVCLYLLLILQKENGLDCDVVSVLLVEIAIYNFDLFTPL